MTLTQAAVLGAVQGLTEFLPISSSGHLALIPRLMGWPDQGLAYDVALHWGTLLALFIYFWRDFAALARGALGPGPERRLGVGIVLATVPGVMAGFLLEDRAESAFRQPERIALCLMAFGVLLWLADRAGRKERTLDSLTPFGCLLVGCAQALAIVPGVSRSGITITAALCLGLRREDAARFSFLMSAPIILGAAALKLKDLDPAGMGAPFWTGIVCSAASGVAAVFFLLRYVRTRSLTVFAAYRLAFGALALLLLR